MSREVSCEYDVEPGISRSLALRRKNDVLQSEIDQLRELLENVRNSPEAEYLNTFRQLRRAVSPLYVTTLRKDTRISLRQNMHRPVNDKRTSALDSLESNALHDSRLKVNAQPWTTIAGNGLVSELLSSFFAYDNRFYLSFVDQGCFLEDMQSGDTATAEYCSPLLVNAICALRCVSFTTTALDDANATI